MSDEEYSEEEVYEEEEEVEEEEEEEEVEEEAEEAPVKREKVEEDEGGEELNEVEKSMLASKKRHEDDDANALLDYEERRKMEREKEEEDLRKLKEKQERRRLEREQEEKEAAEKKKQDEERRRQEEEARRAKMEEEKRKKDEEKKKKDQMMFGVSGAPGAQGGRNFVIEKKATGGGDKFGNIVQAKQEMGMTKEQQEEAKSVFMATVEEKYAGVDSILPNDLKARIKELHQKICKMETEKYDMEKRHERQTYDLKELNERQRQVARNAAQASGAGPTDDTNGRHPPKKRVASKYDRQIDRRNFKERRAVYEHKNAFPCFPGLPPPPARYDKIVAKAAYEIQQELEEQEDADYRAAHEVEEEDEEEE